MMSRCLLRTFLLAFILFLGCMVSAGTAEAQAVRGGGGGGFLKTFFPRQGLPCKDGEIRNYTERDHKEDQYVTVSRVCKNGRFFQKSNVNYSKLRCTEGTMGVHESYEPETSSRLKKTFRCVNGERVLIRVESIPE